MSPREAYDRLARTPGVTAGKVARWLRDEFNDDVEALAEEKAKPLGLASTEAYVTPACQGYPQLLRQLGDPPLRLFHRGKPLKSLSSHRVAVVGSRQASRYGLGWARRLGAALALQGITVCSGLAAGIDTAAHEGALRAAISDQSAGLPVAVLGHGFKHVYPESNRQLRQLLEDKGVVVSEYEPEHPPERWTFPARNRIIAGLCQTVVIVEAGPRSGSLHTARFANESGRDVWVVPNRPGTPNSAGVLSLLKDGARPMFDIDEFVEELVEELRVTHPEPPLQVPSHLVTLLHAVAQESAVPPTALCRTLGWSPLQVSSALSELELLGLVERRFDGNWEIAVPTSPGRLSYSGT